MPIAPAISKLEDLLERPAVAALLAWRREAVQSASFDRNELTIYLERGSIREACAILKDSAEAQFSFLSDLTCVDLYPSEPRFEVIYHLLSHSQKDRVRLIAKVPGGDPSIESLMGLWPAANFFEREVFDLFGVGFLGHPNLRRIMMPEDWEGHPLRKDYPVEGYR